MQNVTDDQLEKLTVKELQELKDRIDLAVRAVIRAKRVGNGEAVETANRKAETPEPVKIDLERERDAWLLAKR